MTEQQNTWTEWSKYVLMELKDINESIKELQIESQKNAIKLARLEEKIAIRSVAFGAIGAAIPVIIMLLITFLKK